MTGERSSKSGSRSRSAYRRISAIRGSAVSRASTSSRRRPPRRAVRTLESSRSRRNSAWAPEEGDSPAAQAGHGQLLSAATSTGSRVPSSVSRNAPSTDRQRASVVSTRSTPRYARRASRWGNAIRGVHRSGRALSRSRSSATARTNGSPSEKRERAFTSRSASGSAARTSFHWGSDSGHRTAHSPVPAACAYPWSPETSGAGRARSTTSSREPSRKLNERRPGSAVPRSAKVSETPAPTGGASPFGRLRITPGTRACRGPTVAEPASASPSRRSTVLIAPPVGRERRAEKRLSPARGSSSHRAPCGSFGDERPVDRGSRPPSSP